MDVGVGTIRIAASVIDTPVMKRKDTEEVGV
jgi:hypothetical protein